MSRRRWDHLKALLCGLIPSRQSSSLRTSNIPAPQPTSSPIGGPAVPPGAISNLSSASTPASAPSVPPAASSPSPTAPAVDKAKTTHHKDSIVDNFALAVDLAEKLAGFFETVPYIAPVAGILSQFVKVYKEVQATDDKRDALVDQVQGISGDLRATILRMEATNHVDLLGRLKPDVEKFASLLKKATIFVEEYNNLGSGLRLAARNQLGSNLDAVQKELESFGGRFRTNRLVDLAIQQNKMSGTLDKVYESVASTKFEDWLGRPPDMKTKQHETSGFFQEGTRDWFFESDRFIMMMWEDYAGLLWIQGHSGTGKSVLCAAVIEVLFRNQRLSDTLTEPSAVAFFYFDFKDKEPNAVQRALRRIVLQLSAQSRHQYKTLDKYHRAGQTLPTDTDLQNMLEELLRQFGRTYIVLDALDECRDDGRPKLLELISTLREWTKSPSKLHLLIASQHRTHFTKSFKDFPRICLDSEDTQADIRLFVAGRVREIVKAKSWASGEGEIIDGVVSKSGGQFRLADCLLVELESREFQSELNETLQNLPSNLFGIYDRFIQRIGSKYQIYATGVLRWLMFANSPEACDLTYLANAIAFDLSDPEYKYNPARSDENANAIPRWLEGLITEGRVFIREDSRMRPVLKLAHASVQDYLLSAEFTNTFGFDLRSGVSHAFLARGCINYLLHFADHPLRLSTLPHHPFGVHAARNWHYYLSKCSNPAVFGASIARLLENGSKQYVALVNLEMYVPYNLDSGSWRHPSWNSVVPTPFRFCAQKGYLHGIPILLQNGADINEYDKSHGSLLQLASQNGHTDTVNLLLERGAAVDLHDEHHGSALQLASQNGHTDTVDLLLQKGATVDLHDEHHGSALQLASQNGHTDTANLLLQERATVDLHDEYHGSALQLASQNGHTDTANLLLQKGATVDLHDEHHGSALQLASQNGHTDTAKLLLQKGATVDLHDEHHGSALQLASQNGHTTTAWLLLDSGANINARGGEFGTALQAAVWSGAEKIVSLLLRRGADVNAYDKERGYALQSAIRWGDVDTVDVLVANGANTYGQAKEHASAMKAASQAGDLASVQTLFLGLGNDVEVDANVLVAAVSKYTDIEAGIVPDTNPYGAKEDEDTSALQAASRNGHIEVVAFLVENGANVNRDALLAASRQGHTAIVHLLLQNGADANWQTGRALWAASANGHVDIVHALLESGADINVQWRSGRKQRTTKTALQIASGNGHVDVVRLLLQNGANNTRLGQHGNALCMASRGGSIDVVRFLLQNGSQIEPDGHDYEYAFQEACYAGELGVVQFLLENAGDIKEEHTTAALVGSADEGHIDVVRLLLENGAEVNTTDVFGRSALESASRRGHVNVVQLLLQYGADVDANALIRASYHGHTEVAKILIQSGAKVDPQALKVASSRGHQEIAELLWQHGADETPSNEIEDTT